MKNEKCKSVPIMLVGVLFVVAGIVKLFIMTPAEFAGMLEAVLGFGSGLALLSAWLVAIFELLGGLAILFSNKFPCKKTYKLLVSVLILIMVVAIISVDLLGGNFDIMGFLKNLIVLSILLTLTTHGKCSGRPHDEKEDDCSECKDGTCTPETHKE